MSGIAEVLRKLPFSIILYGSTAQNDENFVLSLHFRYFVLMLAKMRMSFFTIPNWHRPKIGFNGPIRKVSHSFLFAKSYAALHQASKTSIILQ